MFLSFFKHLIFPLLTRYIEDNELNYQNLQQGMKAMLDEDHLMDAFVRANERQLLQMSQDVSP